MSSDYSIFYCSSEFNTFKPDPSLRIISTINNIHTLFKILKFFLPIRVYPLFLCRLFSNLSFYLSVYFKIIQFSHGSYFKFTFSFFTFFFIFDRRKLYFFAYIFWTLHPIFLSESLQFFSSHFFTDLYISSVFYLSVFVFS